jgi:hypothetical protein
MVTVLIWSCVFRENFRGRKNGEKLKRILENIEHIFEKRFRILRTTDVDGDKQNRTTVREALPYISDGTDAE